MRLIQKLTSLATLAKLTLLLVVAVLTLFQVASAQEQTTEPVYRVASETPANAAAPTTPVVAPQAAPAAPFDLTQRPGEHPLAPAIRVLTDVLANIDQNIRDYSCTFIKRERLDGDLGEPQHIMLKVRHQPFSVYMYFLKPNQGREVLFVDGSNNNEMLVLEAGFKRKLLGQLQLDPNGMVAMRGQKHPITEVGIRNLTAELIANKQVETQFMECQVTCNPNAKIGNRPTTMIQIEHPVPRKEFRANITRIFVDNELRVPIHYDAYLWPEAEGQPPLLDSSYTYANLKLNNGLAARDFDPESPEIFNP